MYRLHKNPILTSYQIQILEIFFRSGFGKDFFLTGGTALSAFYFAHRESKDLDFFTLKPYDYKSMQAVMQSIADKLEATIFAKVRTDNYNELYLQNQREGWEQRIDIVADQPIHFGKLVTIDDVAVDAIENIASNKLLTIFGRLEPKDFIDFYIIMTKTNITFDKAFSLAKQKDAGLEEFFLANSIAQIEKIESWPSLRVSLPIPKMKVFYDDLSRKLLLRIKPKK